MKRHRIVIVLAIFSLLCALALPAAASELETTNWFRHVVELVLDLVDLGDFKAEAVESGAGDEAGGYINPTGDQAGGYVNPTGNEAGDEAGGYVNPSGNEAGGYVDPSGDDPTTEAGGYVNPTG